MTAARLVLRSLVRYWPTGLMVAVAVAVASAVITGSLVVGDSVRGSLRDTALSRLGTITHAVTAPGFFRADLGNELLAASQGRFRGVSTILMLPGSVRNAATDAVVPGVTVVGADPEFWRLDSSSWAPPTPANPHDVVDVEPEAALSRTLARDLGVRPGDDILVTVGRQRGGPEGLFSRRKRADVVASVRLPVGALLSDQGVGGFGLDAQSLPRRTLFLPRDWLARQIGREGVANTLLLSAEDKPGADLQVAAALRSACRLEDYGLRLKPDPARGYLSVQSDAVVLAAGQVKAIREAAGDCGARAFVTSVYLASGLRLGSARSAAYAVVAGAEGLSGISDPGPDGIVLNRWLADDLGAHPGDRLTIDYMVPTPSGDYPTRTTALTVRAVIPAEGPGADPGLSPDFEGITNAGTIGDWDPPFPVDMKRVTPRDEDYWRRWRAAPKAFVSVSTARRFWQSAPGGDAAGWVTSVRVAPRPGQPLDALQAQFRGALSARLDPADSGLAARAIRCIALQASQGSTDYSRLFLGMGMFLVAAAAGLAAMTMRLAVERRASQAGIMLACGLPGRVVARALVTEGTALAAVGAAAGVPLGAAYAASILRMLATRWQAAIGPVPLWLHLDPASLAIGGIGGFVVGLAAVAWGAARLRKQPVLRLLAGWQSVAALAAGASRRSAVTLGALLLVAAAAVSGAKLIGATWAFFLGGAALLAAAIAACRLALARPVVGQAAPTLGLLARRNAAVHRGQSVLTVGLLAGATFLLVAAAAYTRDFAHTDVSARDSGTGGFSLVATASVPLPYDPATPEGRRRLGFSPDDEAEMRGAEVISFLMSPGDDISCLNIAKPSSPRLLAIPPALAARGGFSVQGGGLHPWQVGSSLRPGEPIPALGDSASVTWTLNSGLGGTIEVPDEGGRPVRLRFVGLISSSILAGELLVPEGSFHQLFPSVTRPRYFLVSTPPGREQAAAEVLRRTLGDLGLDVRPTREVLGALMGVQNTYLSTFAALGGLGLLLGTLGLAAALARSVLERRRELALMEAVGFGRGAVARLLIAETAGPLLAGVAAGAVCALIAVTPHLASTEARVNWPALAGLLAAVCLTGLAATVVAAWMTTRGSLVEALRIE